MLNYIARRLLFALVVLFGISLVSFIIIQLPPGDFATQYRSRLINQAGMSTAEAEAAADLYRERYGLDDPFFIQGSKISPGGHIALSELHLNS